MVERKNLYGSKSKRSTAAVAVLYSRLETTKLQRVDPAAYLIDVRRARDEVLLPGELATLG